MYSNVLWKSLELDEYFVYFATIRTQCMDFNVLSIYAIVKSISNGISDHRYSIPKFTHKSVSKCWTNFSMHLRHFLGPDLLHPLGWSPCRNWAGWPSSKERHIFETWRCRKSWGTPNINHYKPSMLGTFMAMETSTWGCRKKSLKKTDNFSKVRHNHRNQQNHGILQPWVWLHPHNGRHRYWTYTLWWTNSLQWKITIFNGKIHYFYGHFPLLC